MHNIDFLVEFCTTFYLTCECFGKTVYMNERDGQNFMSRWSVNGCV
jgi:hypothetical protein